MDRKLKDRKERGFFAGKRKMEGFPGSSKLVFEKPKNWDKERDWGTKGGTVLRF